MKGDQTLPRFGQPPVSEVVFSAQFDRIPNLNPVHMGLWWDREGRRQRYPLCEQRPRLDPVVEEFRGPGLASFNLQLTAGPPAPAIWFLAEDRSELLQVQDNRFTRNWSRLVDRTDYPSYQELRPKFEKDFGEFRDFVQDEGLGQVNVTQLELTYINPIRPVPGLWSRHGELGSVIAPWSGQYSSGFLDEPEHVEFEATWAIREGEETPVGRLHASAKPVFSQALEPLVLLEMTARGRPLSPGMPGALAFLDLAHEWIVKSFTTLTTVPMHETWRRTQ